MIIGFPFQSSNFSSMASAGSPQQSDIEPILSLEPFFSNRYAVVEANEDDLDAGRPQEFWQNRRAKVASRIICGQYPSYARRVKNGVVQGAQLVLGDVVGSCACSLRYRAGELRGIRRFNQRCRNDIAYSVELP
jgi:hypothetical protein